LARDVGFSEAMIFEQRLKLLKASRSAWPARAGDRPRRL